MPLFAYTARSDEGAFVAGSLDAETAELALSHLRTRALFVTSVELARTPRGAVTSAFSMVPVSERARVACFRSLATLVRAGVPLLRALVVAIEECRDGRLQEALRSVASDIEAGRSLSSAMTRRPREFKDLYIAMIRAGELGGVLDEVLERLASMLERDRALQKRVGGALAYPVFVSIAALSLVLFLVTSVVPAFAGLFEEMHASLPMTTKAMIVIASALANPLTAPLFLAGLLAAAVALNLARRAPRLARKLDRAMLAVPIFGPLVRKATIARFSRTLGTLLRSGVALLAALTATEGMLRRTVYAGVVRDVRDRLREGQSFAQPLEQSGLFDALFLQLVRVGEETGTLDAMLLRVADYLEMDVEMTIATLASVLEPGLIIVLGTVVGTIVASVLLPLYSVIGSIK